MRTNRRQSAAKPPAETPGLASWADLGLYPIDDKTNTGYRRLLRQIHEQLAEIGACVLEHFLQPQAVRRILSQIDPLQARAFESSTPHNVYLAIPDPQLPANHPRNRLVHSRKSCLADDEIPADSPLRSIHTSPDFQRFIADCVGCRT